MNPRHILKLLIISLVLWTIFPSLLFAGGVQEERLTQAKALIEQKKYKEARDLLNLVYREDPERQDQIQELLDSILKIENRYYDKYAQALEAVERKDTVVAERLLEEMRRENPNAPRNLTTNLRKLERSIRFVNSKQTFDQLMADGLAAIQAKDYRRAMTIYSNALTGTGLHQSEFTDNDYGDTIKAVSQNALKDLLSAVTEFQAQERQLTAALQEGLSLINSTKTDLDATLEPLWSRVERLGVIRQRVLENSLNFREQGALITKNFPDLAPDYFLDYAWNISRGRGRPGLTEGISGVLQLIWDDTLNSWESALNTRMQKSLVSGDGFYSQSNWTKASESFQEALVVAQAGQRTLGFWNRLIFLEGDYSLNAEAQELWKTKGAVYRQFGLRALMADMSLKASGFRLLQTGALSRSAGTNTITPGEIETDRQALKLIRNQWQGFLASTGTWAAQNQALTGLGYPQLDPQAFLNRYRTLWEQGARDTLVAEITLTERKGNKELVPLNGSFENLTKLFDQAQAQYNGIPSTFTPGKTSRYPTQASGALATLRPEQNRLVTQIQGVLTRYRSEEPLLRDDQRVQVILQSLENLLIQSENLQGRTTTLIEQANAVTAESRTLRNEGEAALSRIDGLLAVDGTVSQARAAFQIYLDRIPKSLDLQEDGDYRQKFEEISSETENIIYLREYDVMSIEVQNFIRQAKASYGINRYSQANTELNRALARWNQTIRNKVENPEITQWKELIANALNSSGDREVLATDPLFVEIRQLLNFAASDYEKGLNYKKDGKDPATFFANAEKFLTKIFIAYPQNKEANVLLLKLKAADSPNDAASFMAQRVADARALMVQKEPDFKNALLQLENLKEFDKNFPGLDADIRTCEIALGVRLDVNALAIARSQTLTNQAREVANSGLLQDLVRAQTFLREAIVLNPNNNQASELNRLVARRIEQLTVTNSDLTAAERVVFNQAQNAFNSGNRVEAERLIYQLYNVPKNRYNASVVRLYKRITQ